VIDDTLQSFYKLNFELRHEHGYSLTEIENMLPWEREVFTFMIIKRLQEKKEALQNANR